MEYLHTVKEMDLEEYLTYVVPSEMKASEFPANAIKLSKGKWWPPKTNANYNIRRLI